MVVDLRSDTVTKPTPGMLEAMFSAQVGDDIFEEDPTIIALERKLAGVFGREAGLFCPSGTMTNQIAIKMHTQPGDEVICDQSAHIYHYEGGGVAFNSGLSMRLLDGDLGRFTATQVEENINPDDIHFPSSTLVALENTSNRGGGSIWGIQQIESIQKVAQLHQLKMHLDGARIFNALAESDYTALELGKCFDSMSICLSKGLGAPVGSVLIGKEEDIRKAKRVRKVFGGAMRQAGYLAAAGIYALDHHVDRIKEDHRRASQLVDLFKSQSYVEDISCEGTNIVILTIQEKISVQDLLGRWEQNGLKALPFGKHQIRLVTHLDFTDDHMNHLERLLKGI